MTGHGGKKLSSVALQPQLRHNASLVSTFSGDSLVSQPWQYTA